MREHYRTHFLEYSLRCEVKGCKYRTWKRRNLKSHEINAHNGVKPYLCSDCDKGFANQKQLNRHFRLMHTLSEEPFVCEICKKSFKNEVSFKSHNKSVHLLEKKFVCDEPNCDFGALTESRTKYHKNQKHSNERPIYLHS